MTRRGVIIVAGGSGTRMGGGIPKQFLKVGGKEILVWCVEAFLRAAAACEIVIVLPEGEHERWAEICIENGLEYNFKVCSGGATRFDSVRNGLATLGECDYIAVHDGARPLVSDSLIAGCFAEAEMYGNAIPAVRPVDSFRVIGCEEKNESNSSSPEAQHCVGSAPTPGKDGICRTSDKNNDLPHKGTDTRDNGGIEAHIIDRDRLLAIQTPQVFRAGVLREAYRVEYSAEFTDDASVVEHYGAGLHFCEGEYSNIKITTPDNIIFAEALFNSKKRQ